MRDTRGGGRGEECSRFISSAAVGEKEEGRARGKRAGGGSGRGLEARGINSVRLFFLVISPVFLSSPTHWPRRRPTELPGLRHTDSLFGLPSPNYASSSASSTDDRETGDDESPWILPRAPIDSSTIVCANGMSWSAA